MSKAIKRNTEALQTFYNNRRNCINQATRTKVQNIINLYSDRKIAQFTTADNLIRRLTTAKTDKEKTEAENEYNKIYDKHKDKEQLGQRMSQAKEDNKRTGRTNPRKPRKYSINVHLYQLKTESHQGLSVSFRDSRGRAYVPIYMRDLSANVATTPWVENLAGRRIFRDEKADTQTFHRLKLLLMTDDSFKADVGYAEGYIACIKVNYAERVDNADAFKPQDEELTNTENVSMYHRYIQTPLDPQYETFKEAIKVEHYVKNECWFNTLTDYKDTLMGDHKREKNKLTKEAILKIINKTEEDFKTKGASITDMTKVFEHFNLQVRIYDVFDTLIYKRDPIKRNHHIPALYAIVKNSHIYTASDNVNMLRQILPKSSNYDISVKASSEYHLNEEEPVECKMITSLDDIRKYTDHSEYTLVYNGYDLSHLFYLSKQAGYEPQVRFSAGFVSELNFKFKIKDKVIKYKVKTQNLVNNSIDGSICVRTEQIYNKMSKAMFNFNTALFKPTHKSYYNEVDVEIFKECRTIPPTGEINKQYYLYNPKTDKDDKYCYTPEVTTEIDVRKAYTSAFNKIAEIPVFTQFDIWKPFNGDASAEASRGIRDVTDFHDLTLYLVKPTKRSLFFNKAYSLVYGMFLKHFVKQCKILYYKQPSRVYKVDYRKITAELWKTDISDKPAEDIRIKKLIANVNFGLLEKNTNKAHKGYAFDTLKEALYYQNKIGGKINRISGMYVDEIELPNGETDFVEKDMDRKYYCLTVTDKATLRNGFIYIKELLLQHHNFKMHTDYTKLTENHIGVWSVKTDAFVVRKEHLRRAKNLIEFSDRIGGWRHEKSKNIAEPTERWTPKKNELIPIPIFNNETRPIENEWDTESIAKDIVTNNPMMIRSKYAGGGKSHIAKHFSKLGYNTLFVVPQNSLSQNINDDAVTTNKFFAIPVGDGEKLPEFDHSNYNCIVFDEIYMNGTHILNRIREFIKRNPNKIIIGAGDVKQLPPIEDLTNTRKPDEYADECINQIFKYNVMLTICKRLGPQGDPTAEANRKILDMMYDDMWLHKLSLSEFVHKYFNTTGDMTESQKNIAYTNMRCLTVSNAIRKSLGKTDKYEVNEILICRFYKKTTMSNLMLIIGLGS